MQAFEEFPASAADIQQLEIIAAPFESGQTCQ
jgi:hypothetical protein